MKPIHITHADAQILESAILIIERVANIAEDNADAVDPTHPDPDTADEIRDMNLEIRDTADRATTAIDYLFEAIKAYDRAGYND